MGKVEIVDPFVSREPEVEVDAETSRILKHRAVPPMTGTSFPPKTRASVSGNGFQDPLTTETR